MNTDSGNCQDIVSTSCKKEDLSYIPSSFMQGFSLRAVFAADLALFAFVALIFLGFVGFNTPPQSATADEGRAATSAPPPVDSLQGSIRQMHFSTITRGSEDHWNDRDFDDSAYWSDN